MLKRKRRYYCKRCKKIILHVWDKKWVTSFCEATGKESRLYLVKGR